MKRLISTLLLTVSIAAAALAQPQNNNHKGHGKPDFEKFQAEKVAFITNEVGLTAEEAEEFWPVFNEIEKQQRERMMAEKKAYIALNKALAEGQGDVAALLKSYLDAKAANTNLHAANVAKYQKILSIEKVAKLYTCEEKFRRQQIGKLGGGKGEGGPHGRKPRPEKSK